MSGKTTSYKEESQRQFRELVKKIKEEVSIEQAMQAWNCDINHTRSGMYHSPLNGGGHDSNPSFHIIPASRTRTGIEMWKCFSTGKSGNVIDLGVALGLSQAEVIKSLSSLVGVYYEPSVSTIDTPGAASEERGVTSSRLEPEKEFWNDSLLRYAEEERRIPRPILKKYCSLIKETFTYKDGTEKPRYRIGFPNRAGGWALRSPGHNPWSKVTKGPGDITLIDSAGEYRTDDMTPSSDRVVMFEGFINFLSWMAWRNEDRIGSAAGLELQPGCDVIVLNSTANKAKAAELLPMYTDVHLYLDNDDSGVEAMVYLVSGRAEERGVSFVFSEEELDWVRASIRRSVDEAESAAEAAIRSDKAPEYVLTEEDKKEIGKAGKLAMGRLNLGGRTLDLERRSLEEFLLSLSAENLWENVRKHNLEQYVNRIIGSRMSSSLSGGVVVSDRTAMALGMHSFAQSLYGGFNDLNDAWKERYRTILSRKVDENAARIESARAGVAPETEAAGRAEDLEVPYSVAEDEFAAARSDWEAGPEPAGTERKEENIIEENMTENTDNRDGLQTENARQDMETATQEASQVAPREPEGMEGKEEARAEEKPSPDRREIPFVARPYEPDARTLSMVRSLDWRLIMKRMGLAVCETRLRGETEQQWVDRNRELFIDRCRAMGPGVLEPMVWGGMTAYPIRLEFSLGSLGKVQSYALVSFQGNGGDMAKFAVKPYLVKDIVEDVRRVETPEKDFLYYDRTIKGWLEPAPYTGVYHYEQSDRTFSEAQSEELRETGRLSCPVDPKTLEPFSIHDDGDGKSFTINEEGNLLCNGDLFCTKENAVLVHTSKWDPAVVYGMKCRDVRRYIERCPVFSMKKGEGTYSFSEVEKMRLSNGADITIHVDGTTRNVHYDIERGCVTVGRDMEQVRREKLAQALEKSRKRSLNAGVSESVKQKVK